MLQGIRASTLPMPPFGHGLPYGSVHKVDTYHDVDPWNWPQQQTSSTSSQAYPNVFDPSLYSHYGPHVSQAPVSVPQRHHSIATSGQSHAHTATPPPPRQQLSGSLVKAQPAFKPTWHGFLDTTKDAMTIVEAALQGRLSHISRRPHDKERAEMLTSGTIIVYEENASGIKRWTDAVHWSPSRVMNNCLIYRQLIRALKPEEKKTALNPSCGGKRKRKESASPSITNTGESITNAEDEYEGSALDGPVPGDATPISEPLGKVYANFAQSLNPDQQRRFCGSLIDSYEFKEGGLMKKTISVKYQGTHHHVISYYSLEDVVNGKLKRPFQDQKLVDIRPRAELLTGWKVSLEDEESKDLPLVAGYSQPVQPSHIQHHASVAVTQAIAPHGLVHLHMPADYWQSQTTPYSQAPPTHNHYTPTQPSPSQYLPTANPQYQSQPASSHQYSSHQSPVDHLEPQHGSAQSYPAQHASSQPYPVHPSSNQHFSHQTSPVIQFPAPGHPTHDFSEEQQPVGTPQRYSPQQSTSQYPAGNHGQVGHQPQFTLPQAHVFDVSIPLPQSQTSVHPTTQSPVHQHDTQRRASAPVPMQSYSQGHPPAQYAQNPQSQAYYVTDQKYPIGTNNYGF